MNIANLTAGQLKQALTLLDRKETLQKQIDDLDQKISGLLGGDAKSSESRPTRARRGQTTGKGRKATRAKRDPGAKRGDMKVKVMSALKAAGESGLSIKELADNLKIKGTNLYAWFGSTGKKVNEIQKIGPAKYKLVAAGE